VAVCCSDVTVILDINICDCWLSAFVVFCCNAFLVMAAKHRVCERKRRHLSDVEPPSLLQAASDLCHIFGIDTKGVKSDNGLCVDYLKYCKNWFVVGLLPK